MKIAVFYPGGSTAWSITAGLVNVLFRTGHEVIDCSENNPNPETLKSQSLIIVSGPEYLWRSLREVYPMWDEISVPKVGWLHETVDREDYGTNRIAVNGSLPVDELKRFTSYLFTPAIQDQKFGLRFLPFGVDTEVFHPRIPKEIYGSIYTGSLYKKRRDILENHPEVRTLSGYRKYDTLEAYADAISRATVVLELPSLSAATSTRVFEVLASKTTIIAPVMEYPDSLFESGKHLVYYQGSPAAAFAEMSKEKAEDLANKGYTEVLAKHTMEHRLKVILECAARHLRSPKRIR